MALTKQNIIENYPLPVYNYKVTIDDVNEGMSFSEISGLEIKHEEVIYRHGFSWLMGYKIIKGQRQPIRLNLKRGVVQQRSLFHDWMQSEDKKNIRIDLCDQEEVPIVSWEVYRALPIELEAPSFNANTNDIAIENLTLIAHDLKVIYHQ